MKMGEIRAEARRIEKEMRTALGVSKWHLVRNAKQRRAERRRKRRIAPK
jgi:hypothetical protein